METKARKILLRSLITVFSIILLVILNNYLNYRQEMMKNRENMVMEESKGDNHRFSDWATAWENHSAVDLNQNILTINRGSGGEQILESPLGSPWKRKQKTGMMAEKSE